MDSCSEDRPWGRFEVLLDSPSYKVKRLTIHPGQRISLQRHRRRKEYWTVVLGAAYTELEEDLRTVGSCVSAPGAFVIPISTWHRVTNNWLEDLVIIEVQIGECDEEDIERREDDYGRAP